MNKLLLPSCTKGLIFVLKSSTEYNIDFIHCKLIFCSGIKICVLMVSNWIYNFFCSQESKFFTVFSKFFKFPQSRKFSLIKEFFHGQRIFPQSRNFSTVKKFSHNQGIFPQSRNFSIVKKISTIK